jgi:nucleoside-diphosphate-sugar epimerase
MDKISVFGGTGFIGSEFCKKYADDVIVIDRDSVVPQSNKVLYLISTIDNYNVLTDPYIDINTNLIHLMRVLENCKNSDTEFIFISSWFVYGETELPANETSVCKPKGFYSITKYSAEMLLESFCKTFNIKYKIIRLGNVVGKTDSKISKKKNALQYLINELRNNNDIKLYHKGKFYRDFIHVNDVIDGIKFIMDNGNDQEIYNLASGKPIEFCDIIETAKEILNSSSKISNMDATDFHKIVQVKSMFLNTYKLRTLGWKPNYTIKDILNELC